MHVKTRPAGKLGGRGEARSHVGEDNDRSGPSGRWKSSQWYSARTMLATLGIHPLAAVVVVVVDSMLFGGTAATGPVGWLMSIPVGIVLGLATGLVQHYGPPRDNRGLAAGKGLLVAVLTAIPTPLPAVLVAGSGMAGAVTMFRQRRLKHQG